MAKSKQPEEEIIYVSKSELKRDAMEFHELGVEIANLSKKAREKLPLSNELVEAMNLADRLKEKKDAYRRHLNYIAKTLRGTDNVEDIHQAMAIITNKNNQKDVVINQIEQIRDELIAEGDSRLNHCLSNIRSLTASACDKLFAKQAKR